MLTDVAVMLADGGEVIADIDVLRHQGEVLGPVASPPTAWRALDEVTRLGRGGFGLRGRGCAGTYGRCCPAVRPRHGCRNRPR
ncbi:MAG: hypothetical protein ACRCZD_12415 [Phycicoccus sp.]